MQGLLSRDVPGSVTRTCTRPCCLFFGHYTVRRCFFVNAQHSGTAVEGDPGDDGAAATAKPQHSVWPTLISPILLSYNFSVPESPTICNRARVGPTDQ
ncbi:hypothetical protein MRB53_025421 [Persea americana]|uniref:Uncharacterized protein n=1 Tax=Persea americana TaxID=3435 RepID=A0ACC2LF61_PERAE|nr:hypothetical protein MRB53_025421 [Persea americana]